MTNRQYDRPLIYTAVAALLALAVLFVGYSFNTSDTMGP